MHNTALKKFLSFRSFINFYSKVMSAKLEFECQLIKNKTQGTKKRRNKAEAEHANHSVFF